MMKTSGSRGGCEVLRFVEVGGCTDDLNDGCFRFLEVCEVI